MTDKELQRLNRRELLELLVEQAQENDKLREEIKDLRCELTDRQFKIDKAGSIAQASLEINNVFEAAQNAADQYLENIKALSGRQEQICREMQQKAQAMVEEAKNRCAAMESETKAKCASMTRETENKAEETLRKARTAINELIDTRPGLREFLDLAQNRGE